MLKWRVAARTHTGSKRFSNGDGYYVASNKRVFCVADGFGDSKGGSQASGTVVYTIRRLMRNWPLNKACLSSAVSIANNAIYEQSQQHSAKIGSSVVAAIQTEYGSVEIAHVGTCRAYLVHGACWPHRSTVVQLTHDHGDEHQTKHWLGQTESVDIEHVQVQVENNDWLILCTDGLHCVLKEEDIGEVIKVTNAPETACETLIERGIVASASDNMTVIAIEYYVAGGGDEPPTALVPLKPKPIQDDAEIALPLPQSDQESEQ